MEIYNGSDIQVQSKVDDSPLTNADLKANAIICDSLTQMYPGIPIVSEENKAVDYETRKDYSYFWCVDPIDGTKEFIKRNGMFTINIGLCYKNQPIFGVVDCPALHNGRKTYYGLVTESVARCNSDDICVAEFSPTDCGLVIVASASHMSEETQRFIDNYPGATLKSLGSSLKLLMIAEGSAHIYPRMAPTCEWDTCAAHAVVAAAGGQVLQYVDGKVMEELPVVYNKENPLNPYFVVYGKRKTHNL